MRLCLALFACLIVSPALAQQSRQPPAQQAPPALPDWDKQAHCERQNRIMAIESAFMLNACLRQEDTAQNFLTRAWEAATPAAKRTCLHQQQVMRMTSYFMLNACIEQEAGAAREIERRPPR